MGNLITKSKKEGERKTNSFVADVPTVEDQSEKERIKQTKKEIVQYNLKFVGFETKTQKYL